MTGRFGCEAGGSMQMRRRCLHADELGPLPTRLGAQRVPQRFALKWHLSPAPLPPGSLSSEIFTSSSTFTLVHFPLLLLAPVSRVTEYLHSWRPPRFFPPAANLATSSSPPPRADPAWRLPPQPPQPSLSAGAHPTTPPVVRPRASLLPRPVPSEPPPPPRSAGMQVSIACTEQNLRSRSSEDRLCGPRPGPGGGNGGPTGAGHGNPPGGGGSGPKARAALVPRPPAPAGALRESTGRGTGMKYRYGGGRAAHPFHFPFGTPEAS